jgi:hypothetical protein
MTFEVDQTCRGAHWERKKDPAEDGAFYPGDTLVTTISNLDHLLQLVEEYGSVRIITPRDGRLPKRFRLQLRG